MAIEKLNIDWQNKGETGYENSKMNKTKLQEITDKIDEIINISNWNALNEDYMCYYRKTGNITELNLNASQKTLNFGQNVVLGVLPNGYRPSRTVRTLIYNRSASSAPLRNVYIEIQASGNVYLFNWETTDTFETLNVHVTFIC